MRHKNICSICGGRYVGVGHNAMPINEGLCCDHCERFVVVPARVRSIMQREQRRVTPALCSGDTAAPPRPALKRCRRKLAHAPAPVETTRGEVQPHYGSDEQMFGAK